MIRLIFLSFMIFFTLPLIAIFVLLRFTWEMAEAIVDSLIES